MDTINFQMKSIKKADIGKREKQEKRLDDESTEQEKSQQNTNMCM